MNSMSRRIFVAALPLMAVGLASAAPRARQSASECCSATLFQNVRIFDGKRRFALRTVQCAGQRQHHRTHLDDADRRIEPGVTVSPATGER